MTAKECRRLAKACRCSMLAVMLAHWRLRDRGLVDGKVPKFPDHEYRDMIQGAKRGVRALGKI